MALMPAGLTAHQLGGLMHEPTNPLPALHSALAVLEDMPPVAPAPQWTEPVWPHTGPNKTHAAHADRVRVLALLLGLTAGADLPQVRAWQLDGDSPRHGGIPVIHAQLAHLDNDTLIHAAIVAWSKALPGGFTWVELWDEGTTMVAARCFFDGVLVDVWTTLHDRITGTPAVTPTPLAPTAPSPWAAAATQVHPLYTAPIPLAGTAPMVAPVEQLLQEV
jgi:hypothetical protein